MSLMLREYTQFVASSTFLEILPFLGKRRIQIPCSKVAGRAQLGPVEMNAL